MANIKPSVRGVKDREDFIDHIQRVEAYLNGADLDEVERDALPAHLKGSDVAEYAAALWDSLLDLDRVDEIGQDDEFNDPNQIDNSRG
jgi:hypothetical protein